MSGPTIEIAKVGAALIAALIALLGSLAVVILRRLFQRLDEIYKRLDEVDRRLQGHAGRIRRLEGR